MGFNLNRHMAAGVRVRISQPMEVPTWSKWDDDHGRISTPVKKRLQTMFFNGSSRVTAEVVYISSETERQKLRRLGQIKLRLREPSGSSLTITADPQHLIKGR